jgi:hypothetical protein
MGFYFHQGYDKAVLDLLVVAKISLIRVYSSLFEFKVSGLVLFIFLPFFLYSQLWQPRGREYQDG